MDLRAFHDKRRALQIQASPASGSDVLPMQRSLRGLLMSSALFEEVEVDRTDDPDGLLIAMCRFRPFLTEVDVAQHLERIWDERVRHPFWEAHGLRVEQDHVEFRAATRAGVDGRYVTVHLLAQRARIPGQRSRD